MLLFLEIVEGQNVIGLLTVNGGPFIPIYLHESVVIPFSFLLQP